MKPFSPPMAYRRSSSHEVNVPVSGVSRCPNRFRLSASSRLQTGAILPRHDDP